MHKLATLLATSLLATVALADVASAHKTTYSDDKKIKIVWGFLNEPAVTWTKTGLDLILSDNATGVPIENAHNTLEASLVFGDEVLEFHHFRPQHGQKGRYTDVVTLTQPGIYKLRLTGTINGSAVDMEIPSAHEIDAVEDTHFPVKGKSPAELSAEVESLRAELATLKADLAALKVSAKSRADTPAPVDTKDAATKGAPGPGLALGLAVLALAAVVVARRRA